MPKGKALAPLDKNVCVQAKDKPSAAKGEVLVFSCTTITRAPARGKITVATLWSGVRAKDMGKTRNDGLARLVRAQASARQKLGRYEPKVKPSCLPTLVCTRVQGVRRNTTKRMAKRQGRLPAAGCCSC
jgi:hypothetical protein